MTIAVLLAAVVLAWPRQHAARVMRTDDLPLTLDLVAAALHAGCPVPDALLVATNGEPSESLQEVASRLLTGMDADEAWRAVTEDPELAVVGRAAVRSSSSGARVAAAFERLACDLRRDHAAAAVGRAHRVGVHAMLPLGLCFLPAFVCLGVVPVIVGIARSLPSL